MIGIVAYDMPEYAERIVKRACKRCYPGEQPTIHEVMIVSANGVAHQSNGFGVTFCGVDATGLDWWWKL